jgi:alpha-tubulin suppressor-like RCC1 family protein
VTAIDGSGKSTGGSEHTCALLADTRMQCWGHNQQGELGDGTTTSRINPVYVCASGTGAGCAGGSVLTGATAIAVGSYSSCAVMADGGAKCWGEWPGDGTASIPANPVDVCATGAGVGCAGGEKLGRVQGLSRSLGIFGGSACAVVGDGRMQCWGDNDDGQLGDGTTTDRLNPVSVLQIARTPLAAGWNHSCSLTSAGTAKCWGDNSIGQLGDGTGTFFGAYSATPVDVCASGAGAGCAGGSILTGIVSIAAGDGHTCFLLDTGRVKCAGSSGVGQIGNGTSGSSVTTPVDVCASGSGAGCAGGTVLSGIVQIAAGSDHTCALTVTSGVKCWGWNLEGQMGDGTSGGNALHPVDVCASGSGAGCAGGSALTGIVAVSASEFLTCALTDSGGVKCWGDGYTGDGTFGQHDNPVDVCASGSGAGCAGGSVLTGVSSVSLGLNFSCAIMTTTGIKCWGFNNLGQLGDATTTDRANPVDVCVSGSGAGCAGGSALTGASAVVGGEAFGCALLGTSAKCWGYNAEGRLGDGTTTDRPNPVDVCASGSGGGCAGGSILNEVAGLVSGFRHSCVQLSTGALNCWGLNVWGQLGIGSTDGDPHPNPLLVGQAALPPKSPRLSVDVSPGGAVDTSRQTSLNEEFTVAVRIEGVATAAGVRSFDVTLRHDNIHLDALSISPGGFFNSNSVPYTCTTNIVSGGTARLACAYDSPPSLPLPSSEGELLLITFRVRPTAGSSGSILTVPPASAILRDGVQNITYNGVTTSGAFVGIELIDTEAGGGPGCDDSVPAGCPARDLSLSDPRGLAKGSIYVADSGNNLIRRIEGDTSFRVAGDTTAGYVDATFTTARFNQPSGLTIDRDGNLYVADACNHRIRKITPTGMVTTVAGSGPTGCGSGGYSGDGGGALSARLNEPRDVAVDAAGNLYTADTLNCLIRRVDGITNVITTVAGVVPSPSPHCGFNGDGGVLSAQLSQPEGVALEPFRDLSRGPSLIISDTGADRIRRIGASQATTIGGGQAAPVTCAGQTNDIGDGCQATLAALQEPRGIALDAQGNIVFANSDVDDPATSRNRIRKIDTGGVITTVAGGGPGCVEPCLAVQQDLDTVNDVVLADGTFAVTDTLVKHVFSGGDVRSNVQPGASPCSSRGASASGDTMAMMLPVVALAFVSAGWRWRRRRDGG